jgi:hypothetical protein
MTREYDCVDHSPIIDGCVIEGEDLIVEVGREPMELVDRMEFTDDHMERMRAISGDEILFFPVAKEIGKR